MPLDYTLHRLERWYTERIQKYYTSQAAEKLFESLKASSVHAGINLDRFRHIFDAYFDPLSILNEAKTYFYALESLISEELENTRRSDVFLNYVKTLGNFFHNARLTTSRSIDDVSNEALDNVFIYSFNGFSGFIQLLQDIQKDQKDTSMQSKVFYALQENLARIVFGDLETSS